MKMVKARTTSEPRGDVMDLMLAGDLQGRKLQDHEILGMLATLLTAAIDPTAMAIAAALVHSGTRPARIVTHDTKLAGCPLLQHHNVLLPWAAVNRNESIFEDPAETDSEHTPNPHPGCGHGPHNPVGLHPGRLMLRLTPEELLARIGPFKRADPEPLVCVGGETRSPERAPMVLSRG
jgi:cytochrome P450